MSEPMMKNFKSLFNVRDTNTWILALSIVANIVWSFFILIMGFYILDVSEGLPGRVQIGLMLAEFTGAFLIGGFCGWLAFDDRGPTYGVIGGLGSVLMIIITLGASGGIAFMLSIVSLAGGFNGGALSRYRGKRKQE
jgi:hypothetical protein